MIQVALNRVSRAALGPESVLSRAVMKHWCLGLLVVAACGGGGDGDDGPSFSDEHPRIYLQANKERLAAALAANGPAAARFKQSVDRWVAEADAFPAWHAALVGQLTGDPKYCAAAVTAIDKQVKDAETEIAAGDTPYVASDSYLEAGELIGDLALVYDWCNAEVGDRRGAWLKYANQTVWNIWNYENATWGGRDEAWSGWGVDDPSNNYHYSFLRATMLLGLAAYGEIEGGDDWRTFFHDQRMMSGLVPAFEADLVGGGSREGTGYGVAMRTLFELYDVWEGSTGESLATRTGHTKASLPAFMHSVVPTLDAIAPTGDHSRDSSASFFDYHRNYVQELVHLFPDDPNAARAQSLLAASSVPRMGQNYMHIYDFLYENANVAPKPLSEMPTAYHAPGIGQLYSRSSWDKTATWVNLIAGPYDQSHAHQDQGALMIYKDGWLAYDVNVDSHSGLRQEPEAHGLVRITNNGQTVEQRTGTDSKLVALHKGSNWLHASADLTPAYKGSTAIQKINREMVFIQPDIVVVYDRVTTKTGTEQVWQLVSPARPMITGARATITASGHTLAVDRVAPATATSSVFDFSTQSDFNGGFRLDTKLAGGDQRFLHVLSIDGAATNLAAETDGVTITLAGGGTARVVFNHDAPGGSITIGGSTTTLGAGLDPL